MSPTWGHSLIHRALDLSSLPLDADRGLARAPSLWGFVACGYGTQPAALMRDISEQNEDNYGNKNGKGPVIHQNWVWLVTGLSSLLHFNCNFFLAVSPECWWKSSHSLLKQHHHREISCAAKLVMLSRLDFSRGRISYGKQQRDAMISDIQRWRILITCFVRVVWPLKRKTFFRLRLRCSFLQITFLKFRRLDTSRFVFRSCCLMKHKISFNEVYSVVTCILHPQQSTNFVQKLLALHRSHFKAPQSVCSAFAVFVQWKQTTAIDKNVRHKLLPWYHIKDITRIMFSVVWVISCDRLAFEPIGQPALLCDHSFTQRLVWSTVPHSR